MVSSTDMQWRVSSSHIPTTPQELSQILLTNRGIEDERAFFQPVQPLAIALSEVRIDQAQVSRAIDLILDARDQQQTIMVFGDYDVDGISATTILCRLLLAAGCEKVIPFIPDRLRHGYGLSHKAIDEILAEEKPDLLITVDNGIVAHAPVARLMEEGVRVIVTDHHAPEVDADTGAEVMPAAEAVVHTTALCGATVAWMLGRELEQRVQSNTKQAERLLDVCGLATIADQVKLLGANRSFAWWGIKALQTTARPGIKALCEAGQVEQADITVETVNYVIGPRINAMGRLEQGQAAFDLLWTGSPTKAKQMAANISDTNVKRQVLTQEMLDHAMSQAEAWTNEHLILVHSTEYHEGVIGLIAGKLVEEFHKPAIVLSVSDKHAKASARSMSGINIVELIRQVRDDLLEVGGHPGAAGFSVVPEKIEVVHQRLLVLAKEQITAADLVPQLQVECLIDPSLAELPLGEETVQALKQFEPCGQGNPRPILGLEQMRVLEIGTIGKEGQHLKMIVAHQDSVQPITCLGWGMGQLVSQVQRDQVVSLAGILEINQWRNRRTLQMVLKDIR